MTFIKYTFTTVLLLCFYLNHSGQAKNKDLSLLGPPHTKRLTEKKSVAAALLLSGFVGFGTGELYARGKWTSKATLFAGLDIVGYGLLAGLPAAFPNNDNSVHIPPYYLLAVLLFATQRGWQMYDSVQTVNEINTISNAPTTARPTTFPNSIIFSEFKFQF